MKIISAVLFGICLTLSVAIGWFVRELSDTRGCSPVESDPRCSVYVDSSCPDCACPTRNHMLESCDHGMRITIGRIVKESFSE